ELDICSTQQEHIFFFQAEGGIRDFHVTGVQTCALPIYLCGINATTSHLSRTPTPTCGAQTHIKVHQHTHTNKRTNAQTHKRTSRSEERRVGKEYRCRRSAHHHKHKHKEAMRYTQEQRYQ